jgi:hypothetical protein
MNDDRFMAQFNSRLDQEPNPQWFVAQHEAFPWLEIGWALAGSLLLFLHFTELRFGFLMLLAYAHNLITGVPVVMLYAALAGIYFIATMWLIPLLQREVLN